MRVLVIGGTGFISSVVARRLIEEGNDVALFHRGTTHAETGVPSPDEAEHIYGYRNHLTEYKETFRHFHPDVMLDMIPYTLQDAQTLVSIARGMVKRLVVISSVDVYRARDRFCRIAPGPPDPTPLTEDSPLRECLFPYEPIQPVPGSEAYTTTYDKILVEQAVCCAPDLATTIVRLPQVYGPGDTQHRCFDYLKRMDDGRPFILLPDDIANWRAPRGYVEDVAESIVLSVISDSAIRRIYHVGDKENLTEADWVRRIGNAAGWYGRIVSVPNEHLPQPLQHNYDTRQDWSLDSSRIREELGYVERTPYDVAMLRTIEWERANLPEQDVTRFDYSAEDTAIALLALPHRV